MSLGERCTQRLDAIRLTDVIRLASASGWPA